MNDNDNNKDLKNDNYTVRTDMYTQQMAAMSHKINLLERYIQVLADKAGVDLDKIHA